MSTVIDFPALAGAPADRPPFLLAKPGRPACRASEIDVAGIAVLLRMAHFERRTIIAKIRLLIEKEGFPEPRTPRFVKGVRQTGKAAVAANSRWARDLVEQWFDDDLPPAAAQASAAANLAATRHRLAERARQMAGARAAR